MLEKLFILVGRTVLIVVLLFLLATCLVGAACFITWSFEPVTQALQYLDWQLLRITAFVSFVAAAFLTALEELV